MGALHQTVMAQPNHTLLKRLPEPFSPGCGRYGGVTGNLGSSCSTCCEQEWFSHSHYSKIVHNRLKSKGSRCNEETRNCLSTQQVILLVDGLAFPSSLHLPLRQVLCILPQPLESSTGIGTTFQHLSLIVQAVFSKMKTFSQHVIIHYFCQRICNLGT